MGKVRQYRVLLLLPPPPDAVNSRLQNISCHAVGQSWTID